jgi:MoxR-like ATPase
MDDSNQPVFGRRLSVGLGGTANPDGADPAVSVGSSVSDIEVAWFAETFSRLLSNMTRVLRGKDSQITLALLGLVSEGHILLEDVPGVGKTSLARAIAESISGSWHRIQFTPDLLPSDVTGISIWNQSTNQFEFRTGPVFANVVVGDEINRASPKTQSALLEVMEERQVTVDGDPKPVPRPFVVIATQNPIEMDGTYNLPEAQLDRFLLKMNMGYPDPASEADMVNKRRGAGPPKLNPVVTIEEIGRMVTISAAVRLDPQLVNYTVQLVQATRQTPEVRLGASPRGTLGLTRAAQSLAAAEGRAFAIADDIKRMAVPVLAHRLIVSPDAQLRGVTAEKIVGDLLGTVGVPGGHGA